MKKLLIPSFLLCLSLTIYGQTFEWLRTYPVTYNFNPYSTQYVSNSDQNGNACFFGMKNFLFSYNQSFGNLFLQKYNTDGELQWERDIDGEALAAGVYSDDNGDIYIYGELISTLDFWGALTIPLMGSAPNDFLVKINSGGNMIWAMNLEDLPFDSGTISELTSDASGTLYFGYSAGSASYVVKISPDGDYIGSIEQQNVLVLSGLDIDPDGNILTAGSCAGTDAVFGGTNYPAPFNYNTYIAKYDFTEERVWVKFIEDVTCPFPKVKSDQEGYIYATSQLLTGTHLDSIVVHGPSWSHDFYLTRLSPEGEFLWALECPEVLTGDATVSKLHCLDTDASGNVLIAGVTRGTIDWGNGNITTINDLSNDAIIWNVSPEGVVNWVKLAGGEGNNRAMNVSACPDGSVYLSGFAGETSVFDTITYVSSDYFYPFLARIDMSEITGTSDPIARQAVSVFPNPASDHIFINSREGGKFLIFDSFGEKVSAGNLTGRSHKIDVADLSPGVYMLLLEDLSSGKLQTSKFIVN